MPVKLRKAGHAPDYFLVALVFLLTVAGLVILASASSELGKIKFNDSYYYLKHQIFYGLSLGIAGFFAALHINYHRYRTWALALLILSFVLLVLVFTKFGIVAGGASRWLQLGPISFQPAELLKLTFIIYLAAWLSNPKMNRVEHFATGVLPFLIISGAVAVLLLPQPATSTVVVLILAGLIMYFLSGVRWRYLMFAVMAGAVALGIVVVRTPYRWNRIMSFMNPTRDLQGSSYQLDQALISIGSGGLWGIGYGQSTTKASTLPAPIDDSIFAVAAQELGFVGAGTLVVLFLLLVLRLFWLTKRVRDRFGELLLVGFGSVVALQSFVNMAAISGLIPLTGTPLPFVSYGGTALAVFLTMSGIAANISRHT